MFTHRISLDWVARFSVPAVPRLSLRPFNLPKVSRCAIAETLNQRPIRAEF